MSEGMTFRIHWQIAKRYGLKAAALFGWLFAQCQKAVSPQDRSRKAHSWILTSASDLARRLNMSRHTVASILRLLEKEGMIASRSLATPDKRGCHYKAESKRFAAQKIARGGCPRAFRRYTIADQGFCALGLYPREWHVNAEKAMLFWGINEAVASKVKVSAAAVFQYMVFWSENWRYSKRRYSEGRLWLPYSVAGLSRQLIFMSEDVIADCLRTLEAAGLIMRRRHMRLTLWAICAESNSGEATQGAAQASPALKRPYLPLLRAMVAWDSPVSRVGDEAAVVWQAATQRMASHAAQEPPT